VLDPVHALKTAKGAFFFQFGEIDRYTPQDNYVEFHKAAPEPKRIATYQSGHEMDAKTIIMDREAWLIVQLGLGKK
jgi:hypothetical protein